MGCFPCKCLKKSLVVPIPESPGPLPEVIVESKYAVNDIIKSERTPPSTQRKFTLFNCPICLMYLSHMLVTKCCSNYLCHFCVRDLQGKDLCFNLGCPHCKALPIHLVDVDPQSSLKKYSDSPHKNYNDSELAAVVPEEVLNMSASCPEDNEKPVPVFLYNTR